MLNIDQYCILSEYLMDYSPSKTFCTFSHIKAYCQDFYNDESFVLEKCLKIFEYEPDGKPWGVFFALPLVRPHSLLRASSNLL